MASAAFRQPLPLVLLVHCGHLWMKLVNLSRLGHVACPPPVGALGVVVIRDTMSTSQLDQIILEHNFWLYLAN